jgi:hypothetical protein
MKSCLMVAFLSIGCTLLAAGCSPDTDLSRLTAQRQTGSQEDNLSRATSLIGRLDSEPFSQLQSLLIFHLNRWIEEQPRDPEWILAPLVNRLPFTIENHPHLEQLLFHLSDVYYLHETSWLHSIANWVENQDDRNHLDRFSQLQTEGLTEEERNQLLTACRLFDWSVRHIQLKPLEPYPTSGTGENVRARNIAPSLGIKGPGYTRIPHEILTHGSGDAWQRGRIFIQLARQKQIKVVYLGLRGENQRRTQPWLTAAMIGEQLFLFDNQLGIPLPADGGSRIATLADLKENPGLLDNLSLDDQPYRTTAADLQSVVALVDACHCALSQRMMILEKNLAGKNQMVLTETPGRISRQMRKTFGIDRTELLPTSMETYFYKIGAQQKILNTEQKKQQLQVAQASTPAEQAQLASQLRTTQRELDRYNRERALLYSEMSELVAGRRLFFRGEFGDTELTRGASRRHPRRFVVSTV